MDALDEWINVKEGADFELSVTAERSEVGLSKQRTATMQEAQLGLQVWFLMQQSGGESALSLRKLVRGGEDPEQFVSFGQKLRPKSLQCDREAGSASCALPFRGANEVHGYALLERGTELSVRVVCEEAWA